MSFLSVSEAARELNLDPSRVRALVSAGELSGVKLGGRWLVERLDVAARKQSPRPAGRPLAPANAWGALFLASGMDAGWLDAVARWRLRQSLAVFGLAGLMPRLPRRSERHRFSAHPGELPYLGERADLVKAGVSAASSYGIGLVPGNEVDGYVRDSALEQIKREHGLRPAHAGEANVLLRAVPDSAWHLDVENVAPLACVAIDLAEEADSRSARIGIDAVGRLDKGMKLSPR